MSGDDRMSEPTDYRALYRIGTFLATESDEEESALVAAHRHALDLEAENAALREALELIADPEQFDADWRAMRRVAIAAIAKARGEA